MSGPKESPLVVLNPPVPSVIGGIRWTEPVYRPETRKQHTPAKAVAGKKASPKGALERVKHRILEAIRHLRLNGLPSQRKEIARVAQLKAAQVSEVLQWMTTDGQVVYGGRVDGWYIPEKGGAS